MEIILASKSPRRRELLSLFGAENFQVIPAEGEEKVEPGLSPGETVCRLAEQKAAEVAGRCGGDALILAADTLVYLENTRLGKPKDEDDAFQMLKMLSGRKHTVYTGLSLSFRGEVLTEYEASDVYFAEMTYKAVSYTHLQRHVHLHRCAGCRRQGDKRHLFLRSCTHVGNAPRGRV